MGFVFSGFYNCETNYWIKVISQPWDFVDLTICQVPSALESTEPYIHKPSTYYHSNFNCWDFKSMILETCLFGLQYFISGIFTLVQLDFRISGKINHIAKGICTVLLANQTSFWLNSISCLKLNNLSCTLVKIKICDWTKKMKCTEQMVLLSSKCYMYKKHIQVGPIVLVFKWIGFNHGIKDYIPGIS
jgi:hypothetical protein